MSCSGKPLQPGFKCIDCWACSWPPGTTRGQCSKTELAGPAKDITTCKAGSSKSMPLFSTRKKCIQGCGGPPPGVACYKCDIQPGESRGRCIEVHPSDPVTRDPLKKCPQWPNIFPTRKECQDKCTSVGPVDPVAICWTSDSECKCQKGQAEGPHGPLSSCDPNLGFYNTQGECVKACEDRKPDDSRTLWIVLGVVGGVLLLLIIIGVILYFVWRRS